MLRAIVRDPARTVTLAGRLPATVQLSSVLLPLWVAFVGAVTSDVPLQGAAFMVTLIILLGLFGLLHELGHILPARFFGARLGHVRISGMGLFVQVERRAGASPAQELLTALGGPLVSGVLSFVLAAWTWHALDGYDLRAWPALLLERDGRTLLVLLTATNVLLTAFNLLPVLPMDGGQALVAALRWLIPARKATHLVSVFGQIMSLAAAPLALALSTDILVRFATIFTAGFVFVVSLRAARRPAELVA